MSFEEEFPSFKEGYDNSKLMVSRIAVQAHCLDKQRVREILYSEGMNECVCGEDNCPRCAEGRMIKSILKRLGL